MSGGQQLQYIGAAPGHYGQLGQVGFGLLHLYHAGDEFCPGRGFGKIVAGADDGYPGGVGLRNEGGQCLSRNFRLLTVLPQFKLKLYSVMQKMH